jgi:hypothetical protein
MKKNASFNINASFPGIRWPLLLPGIALGALGAWQLSGEPNWLLGLPLQALSLWALWVSFPPESKTIQPPAEKTTPLSGKNKHSNWPLILAVAAWFFSFVCFEKHWWIAGSAGVALFLWALSRSIRGFENPPAPKGNFPEKAVLVSLALAAVLLRFPFLTRNFTGFQSDEANILFGSINVLEGNLKTPFGGEYMCGYFPYFLLAFFLKVFGTTLAAARGCAASLSVVAVYFFYRWCRLSFGVSASGLAALFFCYCWWELWYALSPSLHIATLLFEIAAFYFLFLALRSGRRLYFALAGICTAACFWSYIAGWMLPAMMFLALSAACFTEGRKFFKAYWKHCLFALLCFLWLLGPHLASAAKQPGDFFGHVGDLNLFHYAGEKRQYALPYERIVTTFYSLFWPNPHSDIGSALKDIPPIDPFLGLFCFGGIVLAVSGFRSRRNLAALSVLVFAILSEAFALPYFFHPAFFNAHHCLMALPALCFLLAQGIQWTLGCFAAQPGLNRRAGFWFLAFLAVSSAAFNIRAYYFKFGDYPEAWNRLGFCHIAHAEAIQGFHPKDHIVIEGRVMDGIFYSSCFDRVEEFMTYRRVPVNRAAPLEIPVRAAVSKDVVLFLSDWEKYDAEKDKVRKFYPRAVFRDYKNRFGETYMTTIEIPREDIQKLQQEKGLKLDAPLL